MQSFTYPLEILHPHAIGERVRINDSCPLPDYIGLTGIITDRFYSNLSMAAVRLRLASGAEMALLTRFVSPTTTTKGN